MNQKQTRGTQSPATEREKKPSTPTPPTPKEVTEKVEREHAAKPGQGPKNKGSIG